MGFLDGFRRKKNAQKRQPDYTKPQRSRELTNKGLSLVESGRLNEGISVLEQAIELDLNNKAAHVNLGFAYHKKGWLDKAITEFKRAIELDPKEANAHAHLGNAYYSKSWFEQATAEYKRAIELDPDNATGHYNLASAYYSSRRFNLAWKHIRVAEKLGMSSQDVDQLVGLLRKVSQEPPDEYTSIDEGERKSLAASREEKMSPPPVAEGEDPFSEKVIAQLEREGLTINWRYGYKLANRYEVKRICAGGQGVVFIVEDIIEKGKRYAAKSLKAYFRKPKNEKEWKDWRKSVNKYLEECNIWVDLGKYRHIVQAEYLDKIEGVPLVMSEFIDGGDLNDWLRKGSLETAKALDIAIQACVGMEYANSKGVLVHRDIKPGNILVTRDGVAKVNDFGIARAIASTEVIRPEADPWATLDSEAIVISRGVGTPSYMAPEQFPEVLLNLKRYPVIPLGIEADIYAFGLVLYEMISGTPVFRMESNQEGKFWSEAKRIASIFEADPRKLEKLALNVYCFLKTWEFTPPRPSGRERLNAVIRRCLKKDPSERYHSFSELREELMQIYREETGREFRVVEEPPYLPNWRNMGKTYWVLGREKESFECYDKALEQSPGDTLVWLEKGLASAEAGDLGVFGLSMNIIPYLKPSRKKEVQEYKETILNDDHIRSRDISLFNRLALKYAVPGRARDTILNRVEQEFTDPFHEPNPAMSKLLGGLRSEDSDMRFGCAWTLGDLGDKSAVPALMEALKDTDTRVRERAAWALGKLGDSSAVPALMEALKDESWRVRGEAAQALGKLGDRSALPALKQAVKDTDTRVREDAAEAAAKLDVWIKRALIDVSKKHLKDESWGMRGKAAETLGRLGDWSAVPALVEALKDFSVREEAAAALGRLGDRSAVPALIEALEYEYEVESFWRLRYTIINALGKLGDRSAVPALKQALKKEEDPDVRSVVAKTLAELGDKSGELVLIENLKNEDLETRRMAARLLADLGDRSFVPVLIENLKNEDLETRRIAARALAELGDRSAVPALLEALKDKDVRLEAAWALGKLGDSSAVPALMEALKDTDTRVREEAAKTLAELDDKSVVLALMEALTSFQESEYVVVALRWVCFQPDKIELSQAKDKFREHSAFELNKKGSELMARGEYGEALECFERAIEIDPDWEAPKSGQDNCLRNIQ